jgi:hypothetical protein
MKIEINCELDAPALSRIQATLQELLSGENDHPESMSSGHGHALTTAIRCLEEMRQGVLSKTGRPSLVR